MARGLMGGGDEVDVAAPAAPAFRHHLSLPGPHEVGHHLAGRDIGDLRPDRYGQDDIAAVAPVLAVARAVAAPVRLILALETEVDQGGQHRIGDEDHAAPAPAVPAIGTAARHVFLPAEADAAVPAIAGLYMDGGFVEEHWSRIA